MTTTAPPILANDRDAAKLASVMERHCITAAMAEKFETGNWLVMTKLARVRCVPNTATREAAVKELREKENGR